MMIVLSLFDGISCARVALERAGIYVKDYFASEIDKYAIQVSQKNRSDITQIGDVTRVRITPPIDLLIGGSPCQDLSIAKKDRKGLSGERSGLFREYVRILKETRPRYFILENVASMPKEARQVITDTLGVEPIMINAALVSAQNRKRLFWTNIPGVTQPEDRGIMLKDIAEAIVGEEYFLSEETSKRIQTTRGGNGQIGQAGRIRSLDGKSVTLQAGGGGTGAKTGLYTDERASEHRGKYINGEDRYADGIRKLTPIECERLQGLPDDYTSGISNTQRYKCLGNAFNVDVVAHILSFIEV